MKKQIKNIDGPDQIAVFKHDQFFNHMRHRTERCQQHKCRYKNQNRIGYAVKKTPHEGFSDESFRTHLKNRILVQDRGGAEFLPLRGTSRLIQ